MQHPRRKPSGALQRATEALWARWIGDMPLLGGIADRMIEEKDILISQAQLLPESIYIHGGTRHRGEAKSCASQTDVLADIAGVHRPILTAWLAKLAKTADKYQTNGCRLGEILTTGHPGTQILLDHELESLLIRIISVRPVGQADIDTDILGIDYTESRDAVLRYLFRIVVISSIWSPPQR